VEARLASEDGGVGGVGGVEGVARGFDSGPLLTLEDKRERALREQALKFSVLCVPKEASERRELELGGPELSSR
jgi:hypothetical protein